MLRKKRIDRRCRIGTYETEYDRDLIFRRQRFEKRGESAFAAGVVLNGREYSRSITDRPCTHRLVRVDEERVLHIVLESKLGSVFESEKFQPWT